MRGFWATQTHLTSSVVTAPIVLETRCWRAQWSSVAGAKPRGGRKDVLERCWRSQWSLGLRIPTSARSDSATSHEPSLCAHPVAAEEFLDANRIIRSGTKLRFGVPPNTSLYKVSLCSAVCLCLFISDFTSPPRARRSTTQRASHPRKATRHGSLPSPPLRTSPPSMVIAVSTEEPRKPWSEKASRSGIAASPTSKADSPCRQTHHQG